MAYDNTNKWAIWIKTAKSGLVYKSGTVNVEWKEYKITMFDNDKQWNENRPDFNVLIEPIEWQNWANQQAQQSTNNWNSWDISVSDVPF